MVVVSAHLDDAALSASAALGQGDAIVMTVFTGPPPVGLRVSPWDRFTGAASSADRLRERLAEDAAAMALLGARAVRLGEPELQYRDGEPDLRRATDAMSEAFRKASEVWLPAAIGRHPDHVLARDAGRSAALAAGHAEVVLYADFPYVTAYGWPPSVTGLPSKEYLDTDFWLVHELTSIGLDPAALALSVTRLGPQQRAAKAAIIAAYRTQVPSLKLTARDLEANGSMLDYELSWRLPLTPLSGS